MLETKSIMSQFPEVVAEHLLVQIPEQVKGFDAHVGALQSALEQTPEVFKPVGMNLSVNVLFRMVNDLVLVTTMIQTFVGFERVSVNFTSLIDVLSNDGLHLWLPPSLCNHSANLSAPFQNSDNWNFSFEAAIFNGAAVTFIVHESGRATDERFVYFNRISSSAEFHQRAGLHCEPDSVEHEPCGLLSDAQSAGHFVRTDTVLAVRNHPNGDEPLVEGQRRILKDGSNLRGELALSVNTLALPLTLILEEHSILPATSGADYLAIGPAQLDHELEAVVGVCEVNYGLLECLWLGAHIVPHKTNSNLASLICQVYYCQNERVRKWLKTK